MRSDIRHATRRPGSLRLDPPVPVSVVEQPILGIRALHDQNLTQLAGLTNRSHLLHHRVVAQVVTNAVAQSLTFGERDKFFGFGNSGGQGLFAQHVLAGKERMLRHGKMLRIGCADVDRMNGRVAEHFPVVGGHFRNRKTRSQLRRNIRIPARDGHGFNPLDTPQRFQMNSPHKTGAKDCCSNWCHSVSPLAARHLTTTSSPLAARGLRYGLETPPPWTNPPRARAGYLRARSKVPNHSQTYATWR